MDHINRVLTTTSNSPYQFSFTICAALAIGKCALNKYYNKTNHTEVYHIAMGKLCLFITSISYQLLSIIYIVLHTRHKLKYFKKHEWEEEWIQTAHNIICEEFNRSYAELKGPAAAATMQVDTAAVVSSADTQNTLF